MMKIKTLIVYEDGVSALEKSARSIADHLDPERHEVKLRPASEVTIPELLAGKLYFFGATTPESPSFRELARVLAGVNLAGRRALYFGSSQAAVAWLKKMTADSELAAKGSDLVAAEAESGAVKAWLKSIAQ
jgi:hypothetical protein